MQNLTKSLGILLSAGVFVVACSDRDDPKAKTHPLEETHGAIESLVLDVNLDDGFIRFEQETYRVDVKSRKVIFKSFASMRGAGGGGGGSNVSEESEFRASQSQLDRLLLALDQAEWREQSECPISGSIDGDPLPPRLEIAGERSEGIYEVSDATCAETDHSATGRVISCSAYSEILDALLDIVPDGSSQGCSGDW